MSENISEKEFNQSNEELFEVVNAHATPEAIRRAEEIVNPKKKRKGTKTSVLVLCLIVCTIVAVLCVAALLLPSWVPVLCFAGIAACLIVGAIVTDRFILSRR